MLAHGLEECLCVERCGALNPGIQWIGSNDVERARRGENVVARVVVDHFGSAIMQDVVVLLAKVFCGGRRNQWLNFADHHLLDPRMYHKRPRGYSSTKANRQH